MKQAGDVSGIEAVSLAFPAGSQAALCGGSCGKPAHGDVLPGPWPVRCKGHGTRVCAAATTAAVCTSLLRVARCSAEDRACLLSTVVQSCGVGAGCCGSPRLGFTLVTLCWISCCWIVQFPFLAFYGSACRCVLF